jgi:hypothetical protein
VVITVKDPHVEVQLKAAVVAQEHHEVSVNATGRAELVVESKHTLIFAKVALFCTSIHNHTGSHSCCRNLAAEDISKQRSIIYSGKVNLIIVARDISFAR